MRVVPQSLTDIWHSGIYTGANRPIARVTIQQTDIIAKKYLHSRYAMYLFGNAHTPVELPNVKSVHWTRSIDSDAGECEIVLYNTRRLPLGQGPTDVDDQAYNQPGFFTFNRGDDPNRWNHTNNGWSHRLYPDMLIRTWEGYGFDATKAPESDPAMMPSGVWLIDDVILTHDAQITLKCRDAARLLMDQIAFPPVITSALYPLQFDHFHDVKDPKVPDTVTSSDTSWINPHYDTDSSAPYGGPNLSIGGHRASDAFDGNKDSTYWLSIGNASPSASYAYEWVQGTIPENKVAAVRVYVKGGPYRVYVSLHTTDKGWVGNGTVPYDPSNPVSSPNGADIPFIHSAHVHADKDVTIDVKDTAKVNKIRLTFHHLWDSDYGTYQYRAAVRDIDVLIKTGDSKTVWKDGGTHIEGNYDDYTDIVKWLLGYGGFLWPSKSTLAYQMSSDTSVGKVQMTPPVTEWQWLDQTWLLTGDPVLWNLNSDDYIEKVYTAGRDPIGQVWGDIETSGTYGPSDLTADLFDKKPLMDGVAYIRDILGFIFYIDETGAAIFRSPNIWSLGNNLVPDGHRLSHPAGDTTRVTNATTGFVHIDEKQTLMGLQATLSSRNVREKIIIANVTGDVGAVTDGFSPYKLPRGGLRRVAIWSDQHFSTRKECRIMADLIAVRQLFTYRTDTITIPGYPAIQIDDQVKITERVTEEAEDVHYVKGISSTLDMSTGEWTYQLDTHWLGTEPFGKWAFDPSNLDSDTQGYLRDLGKIS